MKVVHIGQLPLPSNHPDSGRLQLHPGRWILNLAKAQLAHTAISPELVVNVPGASQDFVGDVEGIRVHFLKAARRLRSASFFQFEVGHISRYVRQLNPDIVHAHGTEESNLLSAQATRLPYIVTLQGCHFVINREIPPPVFSRARIIELTERFALRRAHHTIAKSDYVAEEASARFSNLCIHKIPNTFDPRLSSLILTSPREIFSMAFVGTVVERKGLHLIAQALEQLSSIDFPVESLHIFGDRPGNRSAYEESVLSKLQALLGSRLITHGTVPAIEVAQKLTGINLLLAPSIEEMFGNQLVEALLAGCKAIVTEGTALAENVRRFGGGSVIPQRNVNALKDAIRNALTNDSDNTKSHARGVEQENVRARIVAYMGPQVVASQHLHIYSDVIAG